MGDEKSSSRVMGNSKTDISDNSNALGYRQRFSIYRRLIGILIILGVLLYIDNPWQTPAWTLVSDSDLAIHDSGEFDWTKLQPSSTLEYVSCYEDLYCARLEVPLDWTNTDPNSARAVLAVIKRPAEVDVTHPAYGGAILFNPGGPGGSGAQFMRIYGESLSVVLNSDPTSSETDVHTNSSRFYDLISWDPRGVGATTPSLEGITDPLVRAEFDQRFYDLAGEMEHPEIFNRVYKIKGMFGKLLSTPQGGATDEEHPARYIGTTSVVRDMVELIEKHGEWREQAVEKVMAKRRSQPNYMDKAEVASIRQRTKYVKGEEKLQYWGFSYGTIVGQTFATMYPERVGRVAIDGVVNITDYYAGTWKTELIDVDKINSNFSAECEMAGPDVCPFAQLTNGTNENLIDGFDRTFSHLHENALIGLDGKDQVYLSDFWLHTVLHAGWYDGFTGYPVIGKMLWYAATRNVSFFNVKEESLVCDNSWEALIDASAAQTSIVCTDADSKINETAEEFYEYVKYLHDQSPHFGFGLSRVMLPCHAFNIRPKWRFNGPWGAETANPLLILSQTLDPVTPLISAQGAASLFPGSQVIEAQGIGHCTLGWPSLCAMKKVREYFRTGKVPDEYTYCSASVKPFSSLDDVVQMTNVLPLEDRYLMASAVKIAQNYPPDSQAMKYAEKTELPDETMGAWWSTGRQIRISAEMEELVHIQY